MQRASPDPVISEGPGAGPGFQIERAVVLVALFFETTPTCRRDGPALGRARGLKMTKSGNEK